MKDSEDEAMSKEELSSYILDLEGIRAKISGKDFNIINAINIVRDYFLLKLGNLSYEYLMNEKIKEIKNEN